MKTLFIILGVSLLIFLVLLGIMAWHIKREDCVHCNPKMMKDGDSCECCGRTNKD